MGSSDELFAAIEAGDVASVASLLSADATLASARDGDGVSAVMRARYRFAPAMVETLMAAEPTLDLFEASALAELKRMAELLDEDPSRISNFSADGFTALHFPAFFGGAGAARLLVDRGADVDAHGRGWMTGTPLSSAAAGRHVDVARILLDAGADPDARQSTGWTPLHAAAHNGDLEMVELLLARGADPAVSNDEGSTALTLAEAAGNEAIVVRLHRAIEP